MQELMLLHSVSRPANDTLFNQFQYEISGAFDQLAFKHAWQSIINRHPAFRTAFIWHDVKRPMQIVRKSVQAEFLVEDLRANESSVQISRIEEYLQRDKETGFDLQRAPLLRFCLFRLAEDKWRFIWTSHHLIIDRWCLGQVYKELDEYYRQSKQSHKPVKPPSTPGFKDYIVWITRRDKGETLGYWANILNGHQTTRGLFPNASSANERSVDNYQSADREIDEALFTMLEEYARANAVTTSIVTQAAWAITLNHLLCSQDVDFDVTVSGRPADIPHVESIIGSFIISVPVRNRLDASMLVSKWLRALQEEQFARTRHEYLSSAELERHLGAGDANSSIESVLVWLAETGDTCELDMQPTTSDFSTSYPLTISIMQKNDKMIVHASTTQRCALELSDILEVFENSLRALVHAQAGVTLGDLEGFRKQTDVSSAILKGNGASQGKFRILSNVESRNADVSGGRERLGIDVLRELVLAEWISVLGREDVTGDADFFEAGGTSLQAASLHTRLEAATRQSIPILALFRSPTIEGMVDTIFAEKWPVRTNVVNVIRAGTNQAPLFCVASPEVNTVGYSLLARHLDPKLGIYVLQSPPEDDKLRQVQPRELPLLASRYLECLKDIQPSGPYRLIGMCTGTHIALEMARLLEGNGERVEFFGIVNTWAQYTISRLYYVNRLMNIGRYYMERIRDLIPAPEFGAAQASNLHRAISNREQMIPVDAGEGGDSPWIREVGFASKNPKLPKLDVKASVFRLRRQAFWRIRDPSLGWALHLNDVDVITISGNDHESMLREPHVGEIAAALNASLGRALSD